MDYAFPAMLHQPDYTEEASSMRSNEQRFHKAHRRLHGQHP